ncbi:MAG: hypothetical protein KA715_09160 [Xanthomonadaceae bacterium]|nr:hypothetical protein [Xanthomonadaceae bacterium]
MKTFIFLALFASSITAQAASDYIKIIGFHGENEEQTKADCKVIEAQVRERRGNGRIGYVKILNERHKNIS